MRGCGLNAVISESISAGNIRIGKSCVSGQNATFEQQVCINYTHLKNL